MEQGKSLGRGLGNPNVGTGMYPIFFSRTASGTGTLRRCRARISTIDWW
jgi:hypothetical protein